MASQRFQLFISTLAIVKLDGHQTTVYIPIDDIVTVKNGRLNGGSLVDVEWNGRPARMFTSDLRERASQVQEASN